MKTFGFDFPTRKVIITEVKMAGDPFSENRKCGLCLCDRCNSRGRNSVAL